YPVAVGLSWCLLGGVFLLVLGRQHQRVLPFHPGAPRLGRPLPRGWCAWLIFCRTSSLCSLCAATTTFDSREVVQTPVILSARGGCQPESGGNEQGALLYLGAQAVPPYNRSIHHRCLAV